jgi:YVTN family beta-propeller protein
MRRDLHACAVLAGLLFVACAGPMETSGGRLFVTNEVGGDISVIDVSARTVVATIPVGKRPRGIRLSQDGSTLFVALSGSPMAPPGIDESTLPPPDSAADGIGVVSVAEMRLLRVIPGGSDPEQTTVSAMGLDCSSRTRMQAR